MSDASPLKYLGVRSSQVTNVFYRSRSPINPKDWRNYSIGDFWVVKSPHELWYLASLASDGSQKNPMATWIKLYPDTGSAGGVEQLQSDVGIAQGVDGSANVFGGSNINTVGSDNTLKINLNTSSTLSGDITVAGAVHLEELKNGVVQANADGSLYTSRGNDGELFIGRTGLNQIRNSFTSSNNSITITKSPGGIDLSAAAGGAAGATDFPTDAGTAQEVAGVLNVLGGTNINTLGLGNTIDISTNDSINLTGNLTINGDINLTDESYGVLQSDALGLISDSNGSPGTILIGKNGENPTWQHISSSDNSINITNEPGFIDLTLLSGGYSASNCFFSVYLNNNDILPNSPSGQNLFHTCLFNVELANFGNAFNLTTGKFIAPENGIYFFRASISIMNNTQTHPNNIYINASGTRYKLVGGVLFLRQIALTGLTVTREQFNPFKGEMIFNLNTNDEVFIEVGYYSKNDSPQTILGDINNVMTSFYGFKIK